MFVYILVLFFVEINLNWVYDCQMTDLRIQMPQRWRRPYEGPNSSGAQASSRARAGAMQRATRPQLRAVMDPAPLHRSVSQHTLVKLKKRPEAYFCPLTPHWEGTAQLFSYMLTWSDPVWEESWWLLMKWNKSQLKHTLIQYLIRRIRVMGYFSPLHKRVLYRFWNLNTVTSVF